MYFGTTGLLCADGLNDGQLRFIRWLRQAQTSTVFGAVHFDTAQQVSEAHRLRCVFLHRTGLMLETAVCDDQNVAKPFVTYQLASDRYFTTSSIHARVVLPLSKREAKLEFPALGYGVFACAGGASTAWVA
jgi:hypothetical protein